MCINLKNKLVFKNKNKNALFENKIFEEQIFKSKTLKKIKIFLYNIQIN